MRVHITQIAGVNGVLHGVDDGEEVDEDEDKT